jgi:predicted Zn finger-like uncharacterized protein
MSLITRCPACSTLFKVVPDQLRVSDGWVRCGQCDEVFDANANLHNEQSGLQVAPPSGEAHQVPSPANHDAAWATGALSETLRSQHDSETEPVESPAAHDEDTKRAEEPARQDKDDFLAKSPHELSRLESTMEDLSAMDETPLNANDGDATASLASHSTSPRYVQSVAPLQSDSGDSVLSFLRSPRSDSAWHKTWVRVVLSIVGLLLVCGLLIQFVLHHRDRIVAHEPAAKPVLEMMCQWLDCRVGPLRHIESIVIDHSSFAKVRGDVYRLNVTLRNAALFEVAMPGLELTLTDMQDQSMVRRVFLAADFGVTSESLAAGAELSVTVPVSIKGAGSTERVSGYRVIAFYP